MADDISNESIENLIFWENSTFHPNIVKEFRRRKSNNNIGIEYKDYNLKNGDEKEHFNYKGPLNSWIRVCSNGNGKQINTRVPRSNFLKKDEYNGFILDGGAGFSNSYGFQNDTNNILKPSNIRLGRDCDGNDIYLESDFIDGKRFDSGNGSISPIGLPSPGVTSINIINHSSEFKTECTVNFVCYGIAQLEFLIPFFMTPGISMIVEFGWNLFNTKSLLPLNDIPTLKDELKNPFKSLKRYYNSYGNYGMTNGIIIDYGYKSDNNTKFDCFFKIVDFQKLFAGNPITSIQLKSVSNNKSEMSSDIKSMMSEHLKLVYTSVQNNENFIDMLKRESDNRDDSILIDNFYDNKPEDRIFCGRNENMFKSRMDSRSSGFFTNVGGKSIDRPIKSFFSAPLIEEYVKYSAEFYMDDVNKIYSNRSSDNNDFDKDANDTNDVWFQLDFIMEYLNLYLDEEFKIDISDVIINAHPNLISCNPNVLIPNPISPKINYGSHPKNTEDESKLNFILNQYKIEKTVFEGQDLYKSFRKAKRVLKQYGDKYYRENLDAIINYIPYLRNKSSSNSRSFPFKEDYTSTSGRIYEKYRYGFLKNIYLNKNRLIELILSSEVKTVEDLIQSILFDINDSVDNIWKLVIRKTEENKITCVDVGLNNIQDVYRFKVGTNDGFIHSYKFDVSLSNEQALNVLFKGGNNFHNEAIGDNIENDISSDSVPAITVGDRLYTKGFEVSKRPSFRNNVLSTIQSNGSILGIHKMTFSVVENNDFKNSKELVSCLNMTKDLIGILRSMLNDGDYDNNHLVYANVADNFVFEISLDGIYGLKVLENFSVENLPKPYTSDNVIFQIKEIEHVIQNGRWVTNIKSLLKGIYRNKKIRYIDI